MALDDYSILRSLEWSEKNFDIISNVIFLSPTIDASIMRETTTQLMTLPQIIGASVDDDVLSDEVIPDNPIQVLKINAKINKVEFVNSSKPLFDDIDDELLDT